MTSCNKMFWCATGMASCPYVPPTLLAPFSLPLMRMLAKHLPDRSLREARAAPNESWISQDMLGFAREWLCLYEP